MSVCSLRSTWLVLCVCACVLVPWKKDTNCMDKGPHLNLVTSLKAVFPSSLLMYLGKALQDGPRAWTPVLGSWPWPWSSSGCCECLGKLANQGPLSLPLSLTLPFKYINKYCYKGSNSNYSCFVRYWGSGLKYPNLRSSRTNLSHHHHPQSQSLQLRSGKWV